MTKPWKNLAGQTFVEADKSGRMVPLDAPATQPDPATSPEVTAAMKAEDVPVEWAEAAAKARRARYREALPFMDPWDETSQAFRDACIAEQQVILAAVIPEIQAQALRDEADRAHTYGFSTGDRTVFVHGERARHLLHERAARLTDTTGEPTT